MWALSAHLHASMQTSDAPYPFNRRELFYWFLILYIVLGVVTGEACLSTVNSSSDLVSSYLGMKSAFFSRGNSCFGAFLATLGTVKHGPQCQSVLVRQQRKQTTSEKKERKENQLDLSLSLEAPVKPKHLFAQSDFFQLTVLHSNHSRLHWIETAFGSQQQTRWTAHRPIEEAIVSFWRLLLFFQSLFSTFSTEQCETKGQINTVTGCFETSRLNGDVFMIQALGDTPTYP